MELENIKIMYDSHINLPEKCSAPKIDTHLTASRKRTVAAA